jgi:hypothetical protein
MRGVDQCAARGCTRVLVGRTVIVARDGRASVGITVIGYLHTYVGQQDQAREPRATKIKKLEEDDQGTVMTNISIRERSLALDQLNRALRDLAARGRHTRCAEIDGDMWLSDLAAIRAVAVTLCQGCPVINECWEAGRTMTAGVWGGVDRDRKWGKPQ